MLLTPTPPRTAQPQRSPPLEQWALIYCLCLVCPLRYFLQKRREFIVVVGLQVKSSSVKPKMFLKCSLTRFRYLPACPFSFAHIPVSHASVNDCSPVRPMPVRVCACSYEIAMLINFALNPAVFTGSPNGTPSYRVCLFVSRSSCVFLPVAGLVDTTVLLLFPFLNLKIPKYEKTFSRLIMLTIPIR